MSDSTYTGRAEVLKEYFAPDSTIILKIGQHVDIVKKYEKWWYVRDGSIEGFFPAICLRDLEASELPALPEGWKRSVSSEGRKLIRVFIPLTGRV